MRSPISKIPRRRCGADAILLRPARRPTSPAAFAAILLPALLLSAGCLRTHHVEHSRIVTTGLTADGRLTHTDDGHVSERSWHGPWLAQPDQARP